MKIEQSYIIDSKYDEVKSLIDALINWEKTCPEYEEENINKPSFLIITVDLYNMEQLEKMKEEHFKVYSSFKDAIKRFKGKIKK